MLCELHKYSTVEYVVKSARVELYADFIKKATEIKFPGDNVTTVCTSTCVICGHKLTTEMPVLKMLTFARE